MLEKDFYKLCEDALSALAQELEKKDGNSKLDFDYSDGILKIVILVDKKTYVINRNSGNQKIWYSSPITGADYFAFDENSKSWRDAKGEELSQKFFSEIQPYL